MPSRTKTNGLRSGTGNAGLLFRRAVRTMARLREPGGCPWDREQTRDTIKPYLIEEAYEVAEAIDQKDDPALKEELGDLLFQILFHARIAEEEGSFTVADVLEHNIQKMRSRHPHVFGSLKLKDSKAVLKNWEELKKKEKRGRTSVLDGVPKHLPALLKAHRIQDKASRIGFDWENIDHVFAKLDEELSEFRQAVGEGSPSRIEEELGDLLFSIVNLARFLKANPDTALRKAIEKFVLRFKHIEGELKKKGKDPSRSTLAEMDALWEDAKKKRKGGGR